MPAERRLVAALGSQATGDEGAVRCWRSPGGFGCHGAIHRDREVAGDAVLPNAPAW